MTTRASIALLAGLLLAACSSPSSGGPNDPPHGGADAGTYGQWCSTGTNLDSQCSCLGGESPIPSELPTCTSASVPHAVCCADLTYPTADDGFCTCGSWGCRDDGIECSCSLGENGDKALPDHCGSTYAHCCVGRTTLGSTAGCTCKALACNAGETEVSDCGPEQVTCESTQHPVPACRL